MNPFSFDEDSTPLTADERQGLIPTHVTVRQELNELEQANILQADLWAFRKKRRVLDESFLRQLHKRMFSNVWSWAGTYRTTERNLGVMPWSIQPDLHQALSDALFWVEQKTYPPDEIAARFHHRLVWIHPFPNGNGRWSRMAADLLIVALDGPRFSWGRTNLQEASEVRKQYITALRAADAYDLSKLLDFIRS